VVLGRKSGVRLSPGTSKRISIPLTGQARRLLGSEGLKTLRASWLMSGGKLKASGTVAVRLTGRVR
jgi:hypothetical protein